MPGEPRAAPRRSLRTFEDLIASLPEAPRRAVGSYWAAVGPGGVCRQTADLSEIYAAVKERIDGTTEGPVAETLEAIYAGSTLPTFAGWRKAIERLEDAVAGDLAAVELLRSHGLCRRRKFNRR